MNAAVTGPELPTALRAECPHRRQPRPCRDRTDARTRRHRRRLLEAEARALADAPARPSATYRLQVHKGFRLDDAAAIVDYLARPGHHRRLLLALPRRPARQHPRLRRLRPRRINPEIGDEADHDATRSTSSRSRGMGRVLDIVPNHMGINGPNRFWLDVLEVGPQSPSPRFFDIDWHPVKEELEGRVLLPILEDQYGKVLEDGKLDVERDGGAFFLRYHDDQAAADAAVLRPDPGAAERGAGRRGSTPTTRTSRNTGASGPPPHNLPPTTATDPEDVEQVAPREGRAQAPAGPALRREPRRLRPSSTRTSPASGARPASPRASTRSTACWRSRSTGSPTGGSPPRRSTTAASSTSTTWPACAPRTRGSST